MGSGTLEATFNSAIQNTTSETFRSGADWWGIQGIFVMFAVNRRDTGMGPKLLRIWGN